MAGRSAILSIKILTDARDAQKGMGAAEKSVGKFQSGVSKAAVPAAAALAAVGVAAISAGRAAAEDAQSQAILAKTLKNSTGANESAVAAVEDHIAAMSAATGVADDELRPAMGALVRATGSADKAQAGLASALDISAATGKDVESVSNALAKGYAGNTTALGRLVPGIDKAVLATGDMDAIMAELARTTGGAAAASADTAAGRMQRMQVAMDEAKESVGAALLPAMSKFATVLASVAALVQKHSTLFVVLAGVIATVAAAIVVINAVTTIYTAVTAIAGAVSGAAWLAALWPILLVIAAVLLVVGAIVLLWKKSETFRSIVLGVWSSIRTAIAAVVSWLVKAWRAVWPVLQAAMKPFLAAASLGFRLIAAVARVVGAVIKEVWRVVWFAIRLGALGLKIVVTSVFNALRGPVKAVADFVKRVWEAVFGALKRATSSLGDALAGPFEVVRRAVRSVIDAVESLISWLGRIKIPKISLPKIPGLNSTATVAAVAPAPGVAARANTLAPRATSTRTAGVSIVINGAIDPESTARQIRRILAAHDRRVGLAGPGLRAGTV